MSASPVLRRCLYPNVRVGLPSTVGRPNTPAVPCTVTVRHGASAVVSTANARPTWAGADSHRSTVAPTPRHLHLAPTAASTADATPTLQRAPSPQDEPSTAHSPHGDRAPRSELTRLADTAVERGEGKSIAVVRGFDGRSRSRAAALRRKLAGRGVRTIDVTPLVLTPRHRRSSVLPALNAQTVGAVVDAGAPAARASQRLAAAFGLPLLRAGAAAHIERRSVLGVFLADALAAVALEAVELRPLDASECQARVSVGDGPSTLSSGPLRFRLLSSSASASRPSAAVTADVLVEPSTTVTLTPHWGPHTLVVDDEPLAPLTQPVTLRCLVGRLEQVRP
jgi:hypothetical protein